MFAKMTKSTVGKDVPYERKADEPIKNDKDPSFKTRESRRTKLVTLVTDVKLFCDFLR
jgi:hypothetical protein